MLVPRTRKDKPLPGLPSILGLSAPGRSIYEDTLWSPAHQSILSLTELLRGNFFIPRAPKVSQWSYRQRDLAGILWMSINL